jgi:hypothetical protein
MPARRPGPEWSSPDVWQRDDGSPGKRGRPYPSLRGSRFRCQPGRMHRWPTRARGALAPT